MLEDYSACFEGVKCWATRGESFTAAIIVTTGLMKMEYFKWKTSRIVDVANQVK